MWICLNNAFLSIVHKQPCKDDELLVRARRKNHITAVFPSAKVIESRTTDYAFRAILPRSVVSAAIASAVDQIDYGNFKDSVDDHQLHDAYAGIWTIMARLQRFAPFSGFDRRQHTRVASRN